MSEKVLGFKKKDLGIFKSADGTMLTSKTFLDKQVPVVSLQALKKIVRKLENCKKNSEISKTTPDLDKAFLGGYSRCIIDLKEELNQGVEKKYEKRLWGVAKK